MEHPLHSYVRPGLVHFMAYPQCMGGEGPIAETVARLCDDPFFELLELAPVNDPAVRDTVRALAEQARVELALAATPRLLGGKLDLNAADASARQTAVDAVVAVVDMAESMGVRSVSLLSGAVAPDYAAAKARLVESLKAICARGLEKGVEIVLETFDQVPYGKNRLIGPTQDAVDISETLCVDYPNFGLLLDLSHLPLIGETSEYALTLASEHISHIHIGNCAMDDPAHPAYGDNHPRFGAPGTRNDTAELTEFLRVLLDVGYLNKNERRAVSFEVKPMAGESNEAVIAGSKRTLEEAWRRIARAQ